MFELEAELLDGDVSEDEEVQFREAVIGCLDEFVEPLLGSCRLRRETGRHSARMEEEETVPGGQGEVMCGPGLFRGTEEKEEEEGGEDI